MVYAYFITNPSELRHEVRKETDKFLNGDHDGGDGESVDERPIEDQAGDLADQWAAIEAMMTDSKS